MVKLIVDNANKNNIKLSITKNDITEAFMVNNDINELLENSINNRINIILDSRMKTNDSSLNNNNRPNKPLNPHLINFYPNLNNVTGPYKALNSNIIKQKKISILIITKEYNTS